MKRTVALFLMSYKGLYVLRGIISEKLDQTIAIIIVGTDKNVINDYSAEIIDLCKEHGIKWCLSKHLNIKDVPEFSIAVSWNRMLNLKNTELIVLHESLLPEYRGFAPLVNQLINREPGIGVTAFIATREYDRGDIIVQNSVPVSYPIKINTAIKLVSELYKKICLRILQMINNGEKIKADPQDESKATYSLWRDHHDYFVDWSRNSDFISRFIDSVGEPYLGAQTFMDNIPVTILDSVPVEDVSVMNRDCGKVILFSDGLPIVVCGKGLLKITNATFNSTGKSIFPLKKFRIRFSSVKY